MSDRKNISIESGEVISLRLSNITKTVNDLDIKAQVFNIEIYEDINYPVVRAEINFLDAINLINTVPFRGEEFIEIKFKSILTNRITTYKFFVYGMSSITTYSVNNGLIYTLNCVSEEFILNGYRIDRHYKDTCDNVIKNILNFDFNTSKRYNFNKALGIQDIVVPNLSPFTAIDFVRQRAIDNFTPFVFYENQYGFNFRSFHSILTNYKEESKEELTNPYVFTPQQITLESDDQKYQAILNLEYLSRFNTARKIVKGDFASSVKSLDFNTKNYKSDGPYVIPPNKHNISPEFLDTQTNEKRVNNTYFLAKDTSKPNDFRVENLGFKKLFLSTLNQYSVRCMIYGNNLLSVGKVVMLKVPNMNTGKTESDDISSPFLISRLRHTLVLHPHTKYTISMDCNKVVEL
jgi:hypothetical protein